MTTIFEGEILAQGEVLARRADAGQRAAEVLAASWADVDYVLVAARGSSDNAAVFFQYLAGQELGLVVALAAPSLFESGWSATLRGAGVLAISQSGRTPGLVEVVERARVTGRPFGAITNNLSSPLARACDVVIDLGAGEERAVASTKTFSSAWHAVAQLVSSLKGSPLAGLTSLPGYVEETARWALAAELPVDLLNAEGGLTFVGRGVGQAVAAELALKMREVSGLRAEAFSAADYLHGPVGADGHGATLVVTATEELSDAVLAELVGESASFGMKTVVLRPAARAAVACDAEVVLAGDPANWCLGLAEVLVGQVFALRVGQARGRPIDTSPGLHKVTLSA